MNAMVSISISSTEPNTPADTTAAKLIEESVGIREWVAL